MESLVQTINNTLHFITVVQEACDQKRLSFEKHNLHRYDIFVKEWKQEQNKSVKLSPKKTEAPHSKKDAVEDTLLAEEMEELALVDNLLEKARNIRLKSKVLLKKSEGFTKKPPSFTELTNNTAKTKIESQHQMTSIKKIDQPSCHKKTVPRSKSASISTKLKTTVIPRSKSANVQHGVNGEEKVQTNNRIAKSNFKKGLIATPPGQNEQAMSNSPNVAILSNNEFSEFKKMHSDLNSCNKKVTGKVESVGHQNKTSNSDLPQDSLKAQSYNCFPTLRRFQKDLECIASSKSSFRLHRSGIWYSFLSFKNRSYLLDRLNLNTLNSFTKAVKLIHQIQEAMLWIDLLSLVGRDTLPSLMMLDEHDWNVIRVCSYLESICHRNLQRVPILDPN